MIFGTFTVLTHLCASRRMNLEDIVVTGADQELKKISFRLVDLHWEIGRTPT